MKPLIAIPCQRTEGQEETGSSSSCREQYIESVRAAGGIPLLIPLGAREDELLSLLNRCDGVLLTGGSDVDPALYHEEPDRHLGKTLPERDALEGLVVKKSYADNIPLLGICRGIQIMNVALGGTLFQDLPSQHPSDVIHSMKGEDRWTSLAHHVQLAAGSRLAALLGADEAQVNSLHHQAVKVCAPGLIPVAHAPDGIVEGVEVPSLRFFIGIQWHPEAMWQQLDTPWLNVFRGLVAAASKHPSS